MEIRRACQSPGTVPPFLRSCSLRVLDSSPGVQKDTIYGILGGVSGPPVSSLKRCNPAFKPSKNQPRNWWRVLSILVAKTDPTSTKKSIKNDSQTNPETRHQKKQKKTVPQPSGTLNIELALECGANFHKATVFEKLPKSSSTAGWKGFKIIQHL